MERRSPFTVALASIVLVLIVGSAISISGQVKRLAAPQSSKTEQLLKQISADYRSMPESKNSFFVSYTGKELKQIDLFVVEVESGVAILFDVAEGKDVDLTPAVLRKLLEFNMQADYIKVGLSDNGAIRVSAEVYLRTANAEGLREVLNQVARMVAPFRKDKGIVK